MPVGSGRSVILPIIVADGDLIEGQTFRIFRIVVIQRPVPAVCMGITGKKLPSAVRSRSRLL